METQPTTATPPTTAPSIEGLWIPLVTPFKNGDLDETSLRRLINHYRNEPLDGLIVAATTGEGLVLDGDELARITTIAAEILDGRMPLYLGLSGSDTRAMSRALDRTNDWAIDGYLITSPYCSRPSQSGLYEHYAALAGNTGRPIIVYNIPYRTGVNIENDTMLRLAALDNIVGLKDCCADPAQSFELLIARPTDFAVLTGEDAGFYSALTQGGDGGILAAAHLETRAFSEVRQLLLSGDLPSALRVWTGLYGIAKLLFAEPSPAPLKHWLWRAGLIDSPEVRLPMTGISAALAARIDSAMEQRGVSAKAMEN